MLQFTSGGPATRWVSRSVARTTLLVFAYTVAARAGADIVLDVFRELPGPPHSQTEQCPFELRGPNVKGVLNVKARFSEGKATVRVLSPTGQVLHERDLERSTSVTGEVFGPSAETGSFTLEVSTQGAVGEWRAVVLELPRPTELVALLWSGPLAILVALGFIGGWKLWSHERWRWFWVGAGIWTVGVALKFLCAFLLNKPILRGLEPSMPRAAYLLLGSVYVGLLTGVFEIGVTLLAGRIWRRLAATARRAVSIGVGAGAFEALLVGLASLGGVLAIMSGHPKTEPALAAAAATVATSPAVWLAGPIERVIAILCHTSSRTLVLLGVATRRQVFFWYGFLIMTAIDAVAGVAHVSGELGWFSIWWLELAIAPFAVISVPILLWALRHWPAENAAQPAADEPPHLAQPT